MKTVLFPVITGFPGSENPVKKCIHLFTVFTTIRVFCTSFCIGFPMKMCTNHCFFHGYPKYFHMAVQPRILFFRISTVFLNSSFSFISFMIFSKPYLMVV